MNQLLQFIRDNSQLITDICQWASILMLAFGRKDIDKLIMKRLDLHAEMLSMQTIFNVNHDRKLEKYEEEISEIKKEIADKKNIR